MGLNEKEFLVLEAIHRLDNHTQREISRGSGVSLGCVNFILKRLLEKGYIKAHNFWKSPHKRSYIYLLTPKGLEEKSCLTIKYILRNVREYDRIKGQIGDTLARISAQQLESIVLVAPAEISKLITLIIKEEKLSLQVRHRVKSTNDLADKLKLVVSKANLKEGVEGVLIASSNPVDKKTLAEMLDLAPDHIFYL